MAKNYTTETEIQALLLNLLATKAQMYRSAVKAMNTDTKDTLEALASGVRPMGFSGNRLTEVVAAEAAWQTALEAARTTRPTMENLTAAAGATNLAEVWFSVEK